MRIIKNLAVSIAIFLFTNSVIGQNKTKMSDISFDKSTSYLHLGVGFGTPYVSGDLKVSIPPIQASFEKGVTDKISVGIIGGYAASYFSNKIYDPSFEDTKYTYILLGARGNYHFSTSEKFDPYVGLTLGYNIITVKVPPSVIDFKAKASLILYGAQIGANYYFSPNVGAFAELGYGIGFATIGLSIKL